MSRYSHDGTSTISSQYIFCYIDRTFVTCDRVDAVCTREHTCNSMVNHTLTLCSALHILDIVIHSLTLIWGCHFVHQLTLGSQYEEGHTKHGISTSGEDGEIYIAVSNLDLNFCTFRAAYPVPLGFLDRFTPLNGFKSIQQTLSIGRNTQTPLSHFLLFYRESTSHTHTIHYFIIRQDCS